MDLSTHKRLIALSLYILHYYIYFLSMKYFLIIIALLCTMTPSNGQLTNTTDSPEVAALNNYVFFANECVHGMLIVHGLLYRFNQDLNKQIDLDSYQVNFYSNKDLPEDIFADTWFYDIAPYDWYDTAVTDSKILPPSDAKKLNDISGRLKSKVVLINQLRFDLEQLVKADMTNQDNVLAVYKELEKATALFEDFYTEQRILYKQINDTYKSMSPRLDVEFPALINLMDKSYLASYFIMNTLHNKTDEGLTKQIEVLNNAQAKLKSTKLESFNSTRLLSRDVQAHFSDLQDQLAGFTKSTNRFFNTAEVPEEYKMYGKYYFYYNKELISKFNRFGIGIVFKINSILDYLESDRLRYMEMPHFYQVVYPKKLEEVEHIKSSAKTLTTLPTKLKDRKITMNSQTIKVDSAKVVFNLYDHMIQDGDIVKLNFNGDWVIDSLMLQSKPHELKLNLNEDGKNYIILHAVNVGRRPPNTMAISYYYRGKKKQIIMKADLNTSEMIEIVNTSK